MTLDDEDKRWISTEIGTQLEAMETRLLTAFHQWASPVEERVSAHRTALRVLDAEVERLQSRVKSLEDKK